jgi:hypothetical protein
MNEFTVIWMLDSLGELANIWIDAPDREAVNLAVSRIDSQLAKNPTEKGEHVAEGLRKLPEPPLSVLFSVREADRIVEIDKVLVDWTESER